VGGLDDIKESLISLVDWPLKYGELFEAMKMDTPKGILLSGPTGTGKTLMAKAIANAVDVNFIYVSGPSLYSRWAGEAEKKLQEVFKKAKQASPCILFFDEIDSLAPARATSGSKTAEHLVSIMLSELDGVVELKGVIILGATNRIEVLEPALLRPGRFDYILEFKPPETQERLAIFRIHTKGKALSGDVDLQKLAEMTEGMVGSHIEGICQQAALSAMREFMAGHGEDFTREELEASYRVTMAHFEEAFRSVSATSRS
jgi:transitional endoplasmic reticulum ATPase